MATHARHNAFLFGVSLVLLLILASCVNQYHVSRLVYNQETASMEVGNSATMKASDFTLRYGEMREMKYDVAGELTRIADSLRTAGIDTIIQLFQKADNGLELTVQRNEREIHKWKHFIPASWNTPSYTLWRTNGDWFLLKSDQAARYRAKMVHEAEANTLLYTVLKEPKELIAGVRAIAYTNESGFSQPYEFYLPERVNLDANHDGFTLFFRCASLEFTLSESYSDYASESDDPMVNGIRIANSLEWFSEVQKTRAYQTMLLLHHIISRAEQGGFLELKK